MVADEAGKAAGAVAALFHLAAIGVEDAVAEIGPRPVGRFHQQYLVAADTEMAVGQLANACCIQRHGLVDPVNHYEIVAKPVHLGEVQFHGHLF